MNIQAMMKQAQKLQKEMMEAKKEVDEMVFEETNSFVIVKANGKKELVDIKIDSDNLDKEDIEMLQDIILVAINGLFKKIDSEVDKKLGKYTQGIPGMF